MPLSYVATIGNPAGTPFSSFDNSGINTDNQIVDSVAKAMPFNGIIFLLAAYFAGNGAVVTARCVAWTSAAGNAVKASTPQFTAPSGTASTNGQTLNQKYTDAAWQFVYGLDLSVFLGWWRAAGGTQVWSVQSGGSFIHQSNTGADVVAFNAGVLCSGPYVCGDIQAYAIICGGDLRTIMAHRPAMIKGPRIQGRRMGRAR